MTTSTIASWARAMLLGCMIVLGWQFGLSGPGFAGDRQPGSRAAAGSGGPVTLAGSGIYTTPRKGSAQRKAIMNAARAPISRELGQTVIFVVDTVRTDGRWAYLQAVPHQPDGAPLDWRTTPFSDALRNDAMSDVVMVLLYRSGGAWEVVDHVIGPTDVHWYHWVETRDLPEALFVPTP